MLPCADTAKLGRPYIWLFIYIMFSGALYYLVTNFPMGQVHVVEPGVVDAYIPLLPLSVPLYLSYALLMPVLVYLGRHSDWLLPAFFAGALAVAACLVCHLFWPSLIVRADTESEWLKWLYRIDAPLAASPSGHIALPVAINLVLGALRVRQAWLFTAWSLVLMVTVMTTGQHVFADVLHGAAVGLASGGAVVLLKRYAVDLRTMGAITLEWICIIVTLRVALYLADWRWYLLAGVIIGARQHALFILYHDATHYLLTRRRTANDFLINMAIGVPGLVPVEFYRPLHLEHHRHTGTAKDPERLILYHQQPWNFRPLAAKQLARQLLGDLLLVNTLRNLRAYKASGGAPPPITRPLTAAAITWLLLLTFLGWNCGAQTLGPLFMLWFIPLGTLVPLLQKIRSIVEHRGPTGGARDVHESTNAWQGGYIGRFFIWPYHINLHLQHHRTASIPWHRLPAAVMPGDLLMPSRALPAVLWSGWRAKD